MLGIVTDHGHVGLVDGMTVGSGTFNRTNILRQLRKYRAEMHAGRAPSTDLFGIDEGVGAPACAPPEAMILSDPTNCSGWGCRTLSRVAHGVKALPGVPRLAHLGQGGRAASRSCARRRPRARMRCHFHNTRNTGIANAYAAWAAGAATLDAPSAASAAAPSHLPRPAMSRPRTPSTCSTR